MKKTCSVLLAIILCFSMFSCKQESQNGDDDNSIQLKLDNYSKYLSVSVCGAEPADMLSVITVLDNINWEGGSSILFFSEIKPISEHFIYNDVIVKCKIRISQFTYCKYGCYVNYDYLNVSQWYSPVECEVVCELDISGNGIGENKIDAKSIFDTTDYVVLQIFKDHTSFEVIEVSGTLTPVF